MVQRGSTRQEVLSPLFCVLFIDYHCFDNVRLLPSMCWAWTAGLCPCVTDILSIEEQVQFLSRTDCVCVSFLCVSVESKAV